MKKLLLVTLLPLLLASCTLNPNDGKGQDSSTSNSSTQTQETSGQSTDQNQGSQSQTTGGNSTDTDSHTSGNNTDTETHTGGNINNEENHTGNEGIGTNGNTTNTDDDEENDENNGGNTIIDEKDDENDGGNTIVDDEEEDEENDGGNTIVDEEDDDDEQDNLLSLDTYREYEFHEGHEPAYHKDWDFYYGTTFEPVSNCLWKNPNEKVDYSGIEFFDKKQYMESPEFKSYPKVEVRFEFWFSNHQSNKYKATDGQPQFKIEEYNSSDTLINTDTIELTKSNVPKTNTPYVKTLYITQSTMTHFNIRFNNFIANGDSGYTAILCKLTLKGWPRV